MAKLRWRLLSLALWLCLFYNIERIIPGASQIRLGIGAYLLGAVATALPIALAARRYSPMLIGALITAIAVGVLWLGPGGQAGPATPYVIFTGACLVLGTFALAHAVAFTLRDFEHAVEIVTVGASQGALLPIEQAHGQIEKEMLRSRRAQRPLSLIVIQTQLEDTQLAHHPLITEIQRKLTSRYVLASAAQMLDSSLRRTDLLIETGQPGRMAVVAPETSEEAALAMSERIRAGIAEQVGVGVTIGIASFPEQGLTFEGLLHTAESRLGAEPIEHTESLPAAQRGDAKAYHPAPSEHQEDHRPKVLH